MMLVRYGEKYKSNESLLAPPSPPPSPSPLPSPFPSSPLFAPRPLPPPPRLALPLPQRLIFGTIRKQNIPSPAQAALLLANRFGRVP